MWWREEDRGEEGVEKRRGRDWTTWLRPEASIGTGIGSPELVPESNISPHVCVMLAVNYKIRSSPQTSSALGFTHEWLRWRNFSWKSRPGRLLLFSSRGRARTREDAHGGTEEAPSQRACRHVLSAGHQSHREGPSRDLPCLHPKSCTLRTPRFRPPTHTMGHPLPFSRPLVSPAPSLSQVSPKEPRSS